MQIAMHHAHAPASQHHYARRAIDQGRLQLVLTQLTVSHLHDPLSSLHPPPPPIAAHSPPLQAHGVPQAF